MRNDWVKLSYERHAEQSANLIALWLFLHQIYSALQFSLQRILMNAKVGEAEKSNIFLFQSIKASFEWYLRALQIIFDAFYKVS